ncbi:UDP-glucose dehydrogenase family protein [Methanobacterium formicicum]|uniref:UDP-glucose 6-dehydrogenase n=1 Tax=Methanobacterium formicicum TaxID=2162 RepID=A0A843AKC8_METFO|nr:UDP-glucose/GDP-mannose dehydrogenase family protein [Methanobacterium formicicum]MBF4474378.1 UDP-glucose/GDP-mannose dehydrogenase family protein [Methanobacterium formicicum]
MKITVIGAGYVGLVTAVCLAELNNNVLCVERPSFDLSKLEKGISHFYEPELDELLAKNIKGNRIEFTVDLDKAIDFSDVIFICVGTPQSDTGKADLSQVENIARQIAKRLNSYKLIIEKSTVPVNTHQWVKKTIKRYAHSDLDFDVASNPEFLREGSAVSDFMKPDRIVVGVESDRAKRVFKEIYSPFIEEGYPVLITTPAASELIKHAANSFLALKISYINMVAELCEKANVDINMVADGIGYDKRVGRAFLNAGIGYGGSCFPKDVKAFINIAEEHGVDFTLLKEVERVNSKKRIDFVKKVEEVLWINKDKNIAVWGLSFKPNTDDIREAPSLDIIRELSNKGANLRLYDPQAITNFKSVFPENNRVKFFKNKYDAIKNADALLILTEWDEFKKADLDKMETLMNLPIIIDGRNLYKSNKMEKFEYYNVGRGKINELEVLK